MGAEDDYDRRIESKRMEIQAIRLERKIATEDFQRLVEPWMKKQSTIRKKQAKISGRMHLYVAELETLHMSSYNQHIPQGVLFKQASLCLYLHTIEAHKCQMRMMTSSSRAILDFLDGLIQSSKRELKTKEMKIRTQISYLQSEITDLEEAFMKMNEARRATLDMANVVPSLEHLECNQKRAKRGDDEKKQLGSPSVISRCQFTLDSRHNAPRIMMHEETFCPNGALAA